MTHRILVIEDERLVAQDIQETLTDLGYSVPVTVASCAEAMREEVRPDLCLVDIHLEGDEDGIVTATLLRERWDVPIVYLTAHSDDQSLERAKGTRPYGYLSKPFNARTLRTTIELALHQYELEKTVRAQAELLAHYAEELKALSVIDPLTGLKNRRGFLTLAEQHLRTVGRSHRPVVVLAIDLDGLKPINDELGHKVGDEALRNTALVMARTFRDCDILSRSGGDEFVVLAVDAELSAAESLCERFTLNLDRFNSEAERPYKLSASIGYAVRDGLGRETLEGLIDQADQAMYAQKRDRKMRHTLMAPVASSGMHN